MRALLTVLIVLGGVAIVVARYWARRAADAHREAIALYKETGSATETARRLYQHERLPDAVRLSSTQRAYVDERSEEFMAIYRARIRELTDHLTADSLARYGKVTDDEYQRVYSAIAAEVALRCMKEWCSIRGIE